MFPRQSVHGEMTHYFQAITFCVPMLLRAYNRHFYPAYIYNILYILIYLMCQIHCMQPYCEQEKIAKIGTFSLSCNNSLIY